MQKIIKSEFIFYFLVLITLFISPVWALLLGIVLGISNFLYNPKQLSKYRKYTLESAIILLGFGLNFGQVISVGSRGILQTAIGIIILLGVGTLLGKFFKLDKKLHSLINVGTCICGGSAIAAVSGVIDANDDEIAVSTGVVFILNAVALFLFPLLFQYFNMSAEVYGIWCALSIHDTSSVVGAASVNETSLAIATILKLTRTLWIIPLTIFYKISNKSSQKSKFPYFIALFLAASLIATFIPFEFYSNISKFGKMLMSPALFMVGYAINIDTIKKVGGRSIGYGVVLWVVSIFLGLLIALNI
ncbi:MAG: putative sulfate exporter family transporter [Ignavibacteria bacterium]|nr:putative sulfate exporter family transporter [Ignavibacteria bacterium]